MGATVDIQQTTNKTDSESTVNSSNTLLPDKKNKRGRPKGARTTRLSEVRKQAAEEKKKIRAELGEKIEVLQLELVSLKRRYEEDTNRLNDELDLLRRRESNYQHALSVQLQEVAQHLQTTLINWGTAELEEAQVDKRGRGRPRKTLK